VLVLNVPESLTQWFSTALEVLNPASFIRASAEPFVIRKVKYDFFKIKVCILLVHKNVNFTRKHNLMNIDCKSMRLLLLPYRYEFRKARRHLGIVPLSYHFCNKVSFHVCHPRKRIGKKKNGRTPESDSPNPWGSIEPRLRATNWMDRSSAAPPDHWSEETASHNYESVFKIHSQSDICNLSLSGPQGSSKSIEDPSLVASIFTPLKPFFNIHTPHKHTHTQTQLNSPKHTHRIMASPELLSGGRSLCLSDSS